MNLHGENEIERVNELKYEMPAEKRTNESFARFFTHSMSEK
jgi:hypothetical protein